MGFPREASCQEENFHLLIIETTSYAIFNSTPSKVQLLVLKYRMFTVALSSNKLCPLEKENPYFSGYYAKSLQSLTKVYVDNFFNNICIKQIQELIHFLFRYSNLPFFFLLRNKNCNNTSFIKLICSIFLWRLVNWGELAGGRSISISIPISVWCNLALINTSV